jgi:hypothetical protein
MAINQSACDSITQPARGQSRRSSQTTSATSSAATPMSLLASPSPSRSPPTMIRGLDAPKTKQATGNRRFLRRLQQADKLPKRDQNALLRTLDAFLARKVG